ncbi:MAG: hypothetical protein ACI4JD_08825 [Ruminococcus sp.]
MENENFSRLFDIAEKNMQLSGRSFTVPKAAFLYSVSVYPSEADILELMEINASREEFAHIACNVLSGHFADEDRMAQLMEYAALPEREYREKVISQLLPSDRIIRNFPHSAEERKKPSFRERLMQVLFPVYKKLPSGVRNFIRKTMGAGE